ncbi:YqgE/AlgH family protein [soil metagenome]
MNNLRGHLLIAGPGLVDPNFHRTVVLVGEHNDDGALGIVLNRPSPVSVAEAAPPLAELVPAEEPLFVGGPVQPQSAVVLAELSRPELADLLVFDSIGFLLGDVERPEAGAVRRARVFAGYAGWDAGQLESEMEESAWIPEPALPNDVFTDQPRLLWSAALRRKGGKFAMLSLMPLDPSLN